MGDTIDFKNERMKREVSPDCQIDTSDGGKLYKFDVDYSYPAGATYGGGTFHVTLWARNEEDARGHVRAMRETLGEPEQIYAEIPA